jgi:hypothetical protein
MGVGDEGEVLAGRRQLPALLAAGVAARLPAAASPCGRRVAVRLPPRRAAAASPYTTLLAAGAERRVVRRRQDPGLVEPQHRFLQLGPIQLCRR